VDDLVVGEVGAVDDEGVGEHVRLGGAGAHEDAPPARDAGDRRLGGGDLVLVTLSPVERDSHGSLAGRRWQALFQGLADERAGVDGLGRGGAQGARAGRGSRAAFA
jgi:hypothetical protein